MLHQYKILNSTSDGTLFHKLTIRCVKKCFLMSYQTWLLTNFMSFPLVRSLEENCNDGKPFLLSYVLRNSLYVSITSPLRLLNLRFGKSIFTEFTEFTDAYKDDVVSNIWGAPHWTIVLHHTLPPPFTRLISMSSKRFYNTNFTEIVYAYGTFYTNV